MTTRRQALLDALTLERFGPPQPIRQRPHIVNVEVCAGCGHFADPDQPCPECRRRRATSEEKPS